MAKRICAYCGKIKSEEDPTLEKDSHGICIECVELHELQLMLPKNSVARFLVDRIIERRMEEAQKKLNEK